MSKDLRRKGVRIDVTLLNGQQGMEKFSTLRLTEEEFNNMILGSLTIGLEGADAVEHLETTPERVASVLRWVENLRLAVHAITTRSAK